MASVIECSSTPSLTNSDETVASSTDLLYYRPLPQLPPISFHPKSRSKGKQRQNVALHPSPATPSYPSGFRPTSAYGHMHPFVRTWSQPRILGNLLFYLSWAEFNSVSRTSRDLRQIFRDPEAKEVVLSHFVPGYRPVPPEVEASEDVRVSLADLEAFMLSQCVPLHRYPMHAVEVVTAHGALSLQAQEFSDRLVSLSQAHTRFVLCLRYRAIPWKANFDSDNLSSRQSAFSGLRELVFPAPLSYFDPSNEIDITPPPPQLTKRRSRRKVSSTDPSSPRTGSLPSIKKHLSLFGRSRERIPLPAPQSSPQSMKYYSNFGRARRTVSTPVTDDEAGPISTGHSRFMSDVLSPPRSTFAHPRSSSSNSSLRSYSPRSVSSPVLPSTSLHDISNALLRTRAPITRVFVPCSRLSESVATAEAQLFTGGLWTHLRPGDIVCNFGYVPEDSGNARGWLIFTGEELLPFFPPEPPPVPDAKALPSPLYYSHLLPPFENPRTVLILPRGMRMTLNLALLSSSAPSPHSRAGFVRVKRYSWLGRLHVREDETEALGLGHGWAGEWILEAEGTKEGRQALIDAIQEGEQCAVEREWLVVREKSGIGKVWLRIIPEQRTVDDLAVDL